jgi:hypothetical protein
MLLLKAFDKAKLGKKKPNRKRSINSQSNHERLHDRFTEGRNRQSPGKIKNLELIHRSQAGDTEAFGELVTKYRAKIYAMLYGMVRNENDAWDLAQEGFL